MIFNFDTSDLLGRVRAVDTRKVSILVNSEEDIRKAHVGHFVALKLAGAAEVWLIGIINRVMKSVAYQNSSEDETTESDEINIEQETVVNNVNVTMVGTVSWDAYRQNYSFSRSLARVPEIDAQCHVLQNKQLENFMNILNEAGRTEHSLQIGKYSIDESATAFIDGNKLFQRHAALLGSGIVKFSLVHKLVILVKSSYISVKSRERWRFSGA